MIQTKSFSLATYSEGDPGSENLALVLPGRLDTKDYAHIRSHVHYLSTLGFYALSFDPPGTWESAGGIEIYTSENYLKAVHEVIEYFGNNPTLLVGHSRGGSMAMLAGVSNPNVTAFVPIMASALPAEIDEEWQQQGIRTSYRDLPPGDGPTEERKLFELPYTLFTGADNLLRDLSSCEKPKLFFLGLQDKQNTPEIVREGYDVSADPKRLYELDTSHGYRYYKPAAEEVNLAIGNFVKDFNLI